MVDRALTLPELAQRTGDPIEDLQQWRRAGLIGRKEEDLLGVEDFYRVQLIRFLLGRGIALPVIAAANEAQDFFSRYLCRMFPDGPTPAYSFDEAAEKLGLRADEVRRFWEAAGLGHQGEWLDEQDLTAFEYMKRARDQGFPEEALVQLVRVYADGLARVADAESRLFHFYVYARLRAQGLSARDALEAAMADRFIPMSEPNVLYFHRKGWQKACRDDAVLHLEEAMGLAESAEVPGQLTVAVAFVDLSAFTSLAEAMGDDVAAGVLERFSRLVREAAGHWEGRVIKQIGDAFMMTFRDAREAVTCLVEIGARAAEEPQFPAVRSGAHWGQVLYREGDYFGGSVNIAARLVAEAERHQVLVTGAVRKAAGGLADVEFIPLGRRHLKGLADEVELFAVEQRAGVTLSRRAVDPVCGMELDADEIAARLSLDGRERVFCSQQCLQRFVAAPERYAATRRRAATPPEV